MYEELGAVHGTVDLTPEESLDRAQAFLTGRGYAVLSRAAQSVTVQRRSGKAVFNLTVDARPQEGGGVRIRVRGNDGEGVRANQAAWSAWSEGLPKRPSASAAAPAPTAPVNLPIPAQVPTQPIPTPAGSDFSRGATMTLGGCIALAVIATALLAVGFVGCLAVLGGSGALDDPGTARPPGSGSGTPGAPVNAPTSVSVRVSGSPSLAYSGSYGTGSEGGRSVEGVLGAAADEYPVTVEAGAFEFDIVTAFFSKMDEEGSLRVEIVVDGQTVKSQETSATYGAVDVTYSPQMD